VITLAFIRGQK